MTGDNTESVLSLDLRGLKCPLPVLKARRALRDMAEGDILEIVLTDPAGQLDFPHFCETSGHELLSMTPSGEGDDFLLTVQILAVRRPDSH